TKPKAPLERHGNEYAAPQGLSSFGVGGYNDVAPPELKSGHFGRCSASRLNSRAPPIRMNYGPVERPANASRSKERRKLASLHLLFMELFFFQLLLSFQLVVREF